MKQKLNNNYIEESDSFTGIFSKFLPEIQSFVQFWDETMVDDESESGLELGEIRNLFNIWGKKKNKPIFGTSDEQTLDLIQYYYPNVIVENYKYIQEVRCSLWNKKHDIDVALGELRTEYSKDSDISIYETYLYYCKRQRSTNLPIVNKSYFDKYVNESMNTYVIETGIISKAWFQ
jgi:hypothetical protein